MNHVDGATFSSPPDDTGYVPGQIILRVHEEAVRVHTSDLSWLARASGRVLPESISAPLDYLVREAGASHFSPVLRRWKEPSAITGVVRGRRGHVAVAASVTQAPKGLGGVNIVHLPEKHVTKALLASLADSPGVEYAEPTPSRWLLAGEADPLRGRQWGLTAVGWQRAAPTEASAVTIATIDSGVDESHPDLAGVVATYDHDGTSATDVLGHGTHVAGLLAAITDNGIGISGLSNCRLAVWKATPDQPSDGTSFPIDPTRLLRSLLAVRDSGASVLSLSLGGTRSSRAEQDMIDGLEQRGITVLGATGNLFQMGNPISYPGAYANVLAVGAVGEDEKRASYSGTGPHIGLVAPGSDVFSTVPTQPSDFRTDTDYVSWSGTSMAVPHVAAAAARLAAARPEWNPQQIRERLTGTARKLPGMNGSSWTESYGAGLVDLAAALS